MLSGTNDKQPKILAKIGTTVVAVLLMLEGASALFWTQTGQNRIAYHLQVSVDRTQLAADAKKWTSSVSSPDSLLGWSPNSKHPWFTYDGRRRSSATSTITNISAYGDSFVFGADVEPDESFPHQLSVLMGRAVNNYGVAGYGPDQAVLRLERDLSLGHRPEIVILGMASENIAGVVNVIR